MIHTQKLAQRVQKEQLERREDRYEFGFLRDLCGNSWRSLRLKSLDRPAEKVTTFNRRNAAYSDRIFLPGMRSDVHQCKPRSLPLGLHGNDVLVFFGANFEFHRLSTAVIAAGNRLVPVFVFPMEVGVDISAIPSPVTLNRLSKALEFLVVISN